MCQDVSVMNKIGIELSSRAMYSSWCWHQPTRTLFDCGEGVSLNLLSRIFGIERICFSHGHTDHIGGLISLIGLRAKTKGDNEKPLDIYFPKDNPQFYLIQDYIRASWNNLPYRITWYPTLPGDKIVIDQKHVLKTFPMDHQSATTLGWKLTETRSRLKAEYRGQDIRALVHGGATKETLNEVYEQNVFCYCLDHAKLNPDDIAGADLAILDCTFLNADDRNDNTHATKDEALATARQAGLKGLVLAHISTRYAYDDVLKLEEQSKNFEIPTVVCRTNKILEL